MTTELIRYYTGAAITTSQPTGAADPAQHGLPRLEYVMSVPGGTHLGQAIASAFRRPDRVIYG
jgi:hypothetical protein